MLYKRKFRIGAAALIAAGTFTFAGMAQTAPEKGKGDSSKAEKLERRGFKGGEGMGKGGRFGKFGRFGRAGMPGFRGVQLSEEQKTTIRAIRESFKMDEGTRQELRSIAEARRAGSLTDDQKARVKAIRENQAKQMQAMRTQIEAILTPEQKEQIEMNRRQMRERMELRRQQMVERRQQWRKQKESREKPNN